MKKSKLLLPLAGIATIGAVAPIVTMAGCSCNTTVTPSEKDVKFLNLANAVLAAKAYTADVIAPYTALEYLKTQSMDVLAQKLSSDQLEFAFDASAKRLLIMCGDAVVAAPEPYSMKSTSTVFKFVTKYDANSKYGQYLRDGYKATTNATSLEIKTSIDTGTNSIDTITYTAATDSKTVVLRTTAKQLNITGASDTIYHSGETSNVKVTGDGSTKCKFVESGSVAYLNVSNVELKADTSTESAVEIGVLEAGTGVKSDDTTMDSVEYYTGEQISGVQETTKPSKATEVTTWADLVNKTASKSAFIRLKDDLKLNDDTCMVASNKTTVCIDLNGKSITDNTAATTLVARFQAITGATLTIMDSQNSGIIVLKNRNIQVMGDGTNTSTINLTGGTIDYTTTGITGAFAVGRKTTSLEKIDSKLIIDGGTIKANQDVTTDPAGYGFVPYNDAQVEIYNGSIITDGPCIGGNGIYDNNKIIIENGTFESTKQECIYHPQGGTLTISGGSFTADTKACVAVKGGDTTISGGTFTSNGAYKKDLSEGKGSGIDTDGSAIVMEVCDHAYGHTMSLTITNGTFKSTQSYIFRGIALADLTTEDKGTVKFTNGTFNYHEGDVLISANATGHAVVAEKAGTWTKI